MTDQEIIEIINASLVEEFELDAADLMPEVNLFTELELDSLDMVDMVIVLEHAFNFKIRDEKAIREIRTVGDIHTFVIGKLKE
ncbi:MAG: acyl carrier protein [Deltaproteobacteria bacterium]|nr:acyl carrier protein [Deltaproteobacteria bacterium]MBW1816865.1 acyl carrier protein [Deltaproteobacteria bacterium]MBW2284010.1 acyl carrier protein [Deltaproteobacteria bacterium]